MEMKGTKEENASSRETRPPVNHDQDQKTQYARHKTEDTKQRTYDIRQQQQFERESRCLDLRSSSKSHTTLANMGDIVVVGVPVLVLLLFRICSVCMNAVPVTSTRMEKQCERPSGNMCKISRLALTKRLVLSCLALSSHCTNMGRRHSRKEEQQDGEWESDIYIYIYLKAKGGGHRNVNRRVAQVCRPVERHRATATPHP
jgi:hypothetical protein